MLRAISPIDGRYISKTKELQEFYSEYALIRARVQVEIEYFIFLAQKGIKGLESVDQDKLGALRKIYLEFSEADTERVKGLEAKINHDVKAVEYFVKEQLDKAGLGAHSEFVHFGLTSQDINNTATPLLISRSLEHTILPSLEEVLHKLNELARLWHGIPMLARTHGQPASPTTVGKEIEVFTQRLERQITGIRSIRLLAKFGGATGNFNAHKVAYPEVDWPKWGDEFVEGHLGLHRSSKTTQIAHYDDLAELFGASARTNTILLDLCRDIWTYISMDYFTQIPNPDEVGSSAMPHKVNPIDFENAEGNLGLANAIFDHLAAKLPISRLQRDLTDSTVLRNVGVPFAHMLISLKSILKGLGKLELNRAILHQDLEKNWAVVAEGIQTILRKEGFEKPYEALKTLTRGNKKITQDTIRDFIDGLQVSDEVKQELHSITPFNYTGYY